MSEKIKIAFTSVGCKLNKFEVQVIAESLIPLGFRITSFQEPADCYVINTCTVTSRADLSSRQYIKKARRLSPTAKIIVTGCYAQMRPEVFSSLGADMLVSNTEKEKLPAILTELYREEMAFHSNPAFVASPELISESNPTDLTRAYVKIQEGCDEKCSFCTIWMARGPVRSRPVMEIINDINKKVQAGYFEAVLTGVHIGKYDFDNINLYSLIKKILECTDISRLRLSSLNPTEINEDIINLLMENHRVCPHLHLSIQSADDKILQAMNRKYSNSFIRKIIERLTNSISNITIGADFITGFPGESDVQFENTLALTKDMPFGYLHVFPYSDRPFTISAKLADKIPSDLKWHRANILKKLGNNKKSAHQAKFLGLTLNVLVEKRNSDSGLLTGLAENYIRINLHGDSTYKGKIIPVLVENIIDNKLYGILA